MYIYRGLPLLAHIGWVPHLPDQEKAWLRRQVAILCVYYCVWSLRWPYPSEVKLMHASIHKQMYIFEYINPHMIFISVYLHIAKAIMKKKLRITMHPISQLTLITYQGNPY